MLNIKAPMLLMSVTSRHDQLYRIDYTRYFSYALVKFRDFSVGQVVSFSHVNLLERLDIKARFLHDASRTIVLF